MISRIEGTGPAFQPPDGEARIARTFQASLTACVQQFSGLNLNDPSSVEHLAQAIAHLSQVAKEAEKC